MTFLLKMNTFLYFLYFRNRQTRKLHYTKMTAWLAALGGGGAWGEFLVACVFVYAHVDKTKWCHNVANNALRGPRVAYI